MKKNLLLALSMVSMTLLSCGGGGAKWKIGICQLAPHEALDAATNAFIKAVKDGLGEANVAIDLQNAAGDPATCSVIANNFVSKKMSLIMANATPAVQAVSNATIEIPILGTSVTEYGVALGIKDFKGVTGRNVSGTSDLAPLEEQAKMITDIFPDVKSVGLFYCAGEANSKYQVDVIKEKLENAGLTANLASFSDTNDISSVLRGAIAANDLIYIPTDNACATASETIASITKAEKIPVVAGEEGICKVCGAVTLTISYENIGKKTGEMAVEILKNGADIKTMPIAYDEKPVKKYNKAICEDLGITVPSDYIEL